MLICVRYNLILLKFDIVKLLLCNTNTTTNANEIKALTRVESEQTAWKYANSVAMGSYTKCLYMSIYCSCWSGGSIVWSTHWNITYTPGTYLLQHVTTVSCRCFSSKFYNSIFLLCSSSSLILIFQQSCRYSSSQLPESERTRNEGLRWAFFWYMQTRQTSLVATKKQWDFMLPKSIDHPQWAIRQTAWPNLLTP